MHRSHKTIRKNDVLSFKNDVHIMKYNFTVEINYIPRILDHSMNSVPQASQKFCQDHYSFVFFKTLDALDLDSK